MVDSSFRVNGANALHSSARSRVASRLVATNPMPVRPLHVPSREFPSQGAGATRESAPLGVARFDLLISISQEVIGRFGGQLALKNTPT